MNPGHQVFSVFTLTQLPTSDSMFVLDICRFLVVVVHPLVFPANGPNLRRLKELVCVTGPSDWHI